MKARKEHGDAKERESRYRRTCQSSPRGRSATQSIRQPHVKARREVQPKDQLPCPFLVPASIAASCLRRPRRAEDRSNREERETDRHRLVHQVIESFDRWQAVHQHAVLFHQIRNVSNCRRRETAVAVAWTATRTPWFGLQSLVLHQSKSR
jgi:hypothetical protein